MSMRASGASEVESFGILHTKSAISFNILSVYKRYAYGMAIFYKR